MLTALGETWTYPACAIVCFAFAMAFGAVWCRLQAERKQTERERRGREELEAYARLDLRVSSQGDLKHLPRRVCSVITARSPFSRVAMLMYMPDGHLGIAATEGMDAATAEAIEAHLEDRQPSRDAIEYWDGASQVRLGLYSCVIPLQSEQRPGGRAILIPIRASDQKMGALLVCADSILQVPHRLAEEAVVGLEALATRLGYAMENIPSALQPRPSGFLNEGAHNFESIRFIGSHYESRQGLAM
jgi:hypothetical protein